MVAHPETEIPPIADHVHSEHRGLLRDGLLNSLSYVVSLLAGLILVPALLAGLGKETYGLYVAALALQYAITLGAGLGRSVSREVAARHGTRDELLNEFVSRVGGAYLLFGAVGGTAIAVLGLPLSAGLHVSPESAHVARIGFALAAVAFFGDQVAGFATEVLTGMRRFVLMNVVASGAVILRLAVLLSILRVAPSLTYVMLWHGALSLATGLVLLWLVVHSEPGFLPRIASFRWHRFAAEFEFSFVSQLTSWFNALLWRSGTFVLGLARGSAAIAPYDIGQKFPTILVNASWQAAEVLYPGASRHLRHDEPKRYTSALLTIGTRWLLVIVLPVCLLLAFIAPVLLHLWIGPQYPDAALVLRLGAAVVLFDIFAATSVQILWAQGEVRKILTVTAAAAAICTILALVLLKQFGVAAPAIALLVCVALASAVYCVLACRWSSIPFADFWRESTHGIGLSALAEIVVLTVTLRYFRIETWPTLLATSIVAVAAYAAIFSVAGITASDRTLLREVVLKPRQLLRSARIRMEGVPLLRPVIHFVMEVRAAVLTTSAADTRILNETYTARSDPFFSLTETEQRRFTDGLALIDSVARSNFPRALEVGCSEGYFTEMIAPRCDHLDALDISAVALERARQRCLAHTNIDFSNGDIRSLSLAPSSYDLVAAIGILEYIRRPNELTHAAENLIRSVRPGGYLLIGNTATDDDTENTLIGKLLIRGTRINRWFEKHPLLETIRVVRGDYICPFEQTLLRKVQPGA